MGYIAPHVKVDSHPENGMRDFDPSMTFFLEGWSSSLASTHPQNPLAQVLFQESSPLMESFGRGVDVEFPSQGRTVKSFELPR